MSRPFCLYNDSMTKQQGASPSVRRNVNRQIRLVSSFLWYLRKNMKSGLLSSTVFRQALGRFATGVTVVTAERAPGEVHGMTANSFTAVSLEPLLVLVCVDEQARMLPVLKRAQRFGVSVLKNYQRAISDFFAQPEQDPEAERALGIRFEWPAPGIPVLGDALVQLTCRVVASHLAGDHTIFLGEVENAEVFEGEPLLFFRGSYRRISAE
jgi:flavin reductase (DIM6/NTAB) family NADH-FMN oxidoreductase RutF